MSVFSEAYLNTLLPALATADDAQLHGIIKACAIAIASLPTSIPNDGILELSDRAYNALEARWRSQGRSLPYKHELVRLDELPVAHSPRFIIMRGSN